MPADLLKSFLSFNESKKLFNKDEKIGLAVSGGLDSIVLLNLFYQLQDEWNLQFTVLHFNHQLRPKSARDADFVEQICHEKNMPFERGAEDVSAFAQKHKVSIEMAARECRYRFFRDMREKHNLDKIATAHNGNDQAETVLHHILRGSGVNGLHGIPAQRDCFIRPLLFAQRDDIHQYAVEHGLKWREDHSNQDESFTRNRIRHSLLPVLRDQFNPQIVAALNRLAESAQEHDTIIQHAAQQAFENCVRQTDENEFVLEIERFLTYLKSLQRLILQRILIALDNDPNEITFNILEGILTFLRKRQSGTTFFVTESCRLTIARNDAVFHSAENVDFKMSLPTRTGVFELWNSLFLEINEDSPPLTFEKNRDNELIDADKLGSQLIVRSFQHADFFYPVNGVGRKKLSDLFIDEKVPVHQRRDIPILESDGDIVWVGGFRLDDRFKVTKNSKRIYKLTIRTRGK